MTRKMTLTLVSVLSLAVAASAVQAQEAAKPAPEVPRGFAMMDYNGDGKITVEDFTEKKLATQKAMDPNADGFVTLEEMKAFAGEQARARAEAHAERRFKALDTDGDGRLSAVEALMGQAGPRGKGPGPEGFIARADANKDGAVSPEEFTAAHKAMREAMRGHGKRGERGHDGHGPRGEHHHEGKGPQKP